MGKSRVKGIVVEIGGDTGPLDKALQGTNKNISATQSKLKDVERLLKLDPNNTVLLEQKQKLLAQAIAETEGKLQTLNDANDQVKDSVKNYDAWKAAYDPIQTEIDATKQKLKELKNQQQEMADCGEVDTDAYQQLTQEIQNTNKELRDLKDQAEKVNEEFGNPANPDQYDALQREIIETQQELQRLKDKAEDSWEDAANATKQLQRELQEVNRLLEYDDSNVTLLDQKHELLTDAIEKSKKAIEKMEDAYNGLLGKSGPGITDHTEDIRQLERQIEAAKIELRDLTREAETTGKQLGIIDPEPVDAVAVALEKATEKCDSLERELDTVNSALDLDPSNIQLLTQKQDILTDSVEETRKKLELLEQQQDSISQQYASGDIDRGAYLEFQNEIVKTKKKLDDLESSAKSNMDNIADAVDGTKAKLKQLGDTAETVKTKADGIAEKFQSVTAAVAGIATAVAATVPATEELREDLSKLDANAKEHTVSVDAAREAWKAFAIQSGETDSAVEAVSNLLQADFTESNLQKAVEGLAGAALRFPDTLKIESLADSLQETLASGEATGQFSELLSRLGMDVETFNNNLAACTSEAERQNMVLQTLADAGLNDTYQAWKNNNAEMLANKDANLELQQSMADLAQDVLPVTTRVTNAISEFIKWFANLPGPVQGAIGAIALFLGAISPVAGAVSNVSDLVGLLSKTDLPGLSSVLGGLSGTTLPGFRSVFSSVFHFIASNPVVALVGAVAIFGDDTQNILQGVDDFLQQIFATDWEQVFGPVLGGALNRFFNKVKNIWDAIKKILDGVIDFIRGVFTGDWERAWRGVSSILEGIFNGLLDIVQVPINGIIGLVNGIISACNLAIESLNKLPGVEIDTIQKIEYWESSSRKTGSVTGLEMTQEEIDRIIEKDPEYMVSLLDSSSTGNQSTVSNSYSTNNTFTGDIVINAAEGQDVEEMGNLVMEAVQRHYESAEAGLS